MHKFLTFLVSLVCLQCYVNADDRVVVVDYSPNQIVDIYTGTGYATTIEFGNESVNAIAIGDTANFQASPFKNKVFIKPTENATSKELKSTNMTVVTDKRDYYFQVYLNSKKKATFILKFNYGAPRSARNNYSSYSSQGAPASSQVSRSAPASSQVSRSAPASSQVSRSAPASSQVSRSVPVSSQVSRSVPASSQVSQSAPVSSQVNRSVPASSQVNRSTPVSGSHQVGRSVPSTSTNTTSQVQHNRKNDGGFNREKLDEPPRARSSLLVTRNVNSHSHYKISVNSKILIDTIYDNGVNTFFIFNEKQKVPAIYYVDEEGREFLLVPETDLKSGAISVNKVNERFTLRLGNEVVCVLNDKMIHPELYRPTPDPSIDRFNRDGRGRHNSGNHKKSKKIRK